VVGILLGVPFGFAVRIVVGAAWATCGIGSEAVGGTFALVLLAVPTALLSVAGVTVTLADRGARVLGAAATMLALVRARWLVLAVLATPAGRPDPVCHPGHVPPWLPPWLPL
jgi:hypothetical protein